MLPWNYFHLTQSPTRGFALRLLRKWNYWTWWRRVCHGQKSAARTTSRPVPFATSLGKSRRLGRFMRKMVIPIDSASEKLLITNLKQNLQNGFLPFKKGISQSAVRLYKTKPLKWQSWWQLRVSRRLTDGLNGSRNGKTSILREDIVLYYNPIIFCSVCYDSLPPSAPPSLGIASCWNVDFCPRRHLNSVEDYSSSSVGVVCRVVRLQS